MSYKVKHLNVLYFYSIYWSILLYFKKDVAFSERYNIISEKLMSRYNNDDCYSFYDKYSIDLENKKDAILKVCSFFLQNPEQYHISNFNPKKKTDLFVYSINKVKLIEDFKGELENDLVQQLLSGRLYSKMSTNKQIDLELFSYINVFYPIVKLARSYKSKDTYFNILDSLNKKKTVEAETSIEKCSNILRRYIETDELKNKEIKEYISILIQNKITEINRKTDLIPKNTEETDYDIFTC